MNGNEHLIETRWSPRWNGDNNNDDDDDDENNDDNYNNQDDDDAFGLMGY